MWVYNLTYAFSNYSRGQKKIEEKSPWLGNIWNKKKMPYKQTREVNQKITDEKSNMIAYLKFSLSNVVKQIFPYGVIPDIG